MLAGEGDREEEGGAAAGLALDPDAAVVLLDNQLGDGQAQAVAARFGAGGAIGLVEAPEDAIMLLGGSSADDRIVATSRRITARSSPASIRRCSRSDHPLIAASWFLRSWKIV